MTDAQHKPWLERLFRGDSLDRSAARAVMEAMLGGQVGDAVIGAFAGAIQTRGVSVDELTGFAEAIRAKALTVTLERTPVLDNCGTGGDGLSTFNFSTAAAFVVAGAGVGVAKHGNRAVSSRSGSADVLEALGVSADDPADVVQRNITEVGFGFFFAPKFHPALKSIGAVRRSLAVRTVFNLLGPLAHPAKVKRQLVGIFDPKRLYDYGRALLNLGLERGMVVHGADGMDELTLTGPTQVCQIRHGRVWLETVFPEEAGLKRVAAEQLRGGDAQENAARLERMLAGAEGPLTEATVFNAAAALVITDTAPTLADGVELARQALKSGKALAVLAELRRRKAASQGAAPHSATER